MNIRIILFQLALGLCITAFTQTPEELANEQLEAYNNRDIEAFLVPYSDSVKVYNDQRVLLFQGKETMREQYEGLFDRTPNLNCNLLNRIAIGDTVIEHEEVTFGDRTIYAIVMYRIALNKIQEVHFLGRE